MTNFEQWSGRREGIVTSENYSSKQAFDRTLDDLWDTDFKWSDELNPDIPRLDFLGDIIAGKEKGFYYARSDHVNFDNLERMLTAIETGRLSQADSFGAKVFASGMAAITAALKSLSAGKDGVFITGKVMYSSTKAILEDEGNGRNAIGTYPGITVDLNVPGALEAAIKEQKAKGIDVLGVIFEPIANPSIEYTDTREVAKVAHRYNVPVIVDNTFLTPYLQEPFRMGADMVVHSLTKYFSGKGDMTGGVVIAPKELIPGVQNVRKNQGGIMSIRDAQEFGSRAGYVASVVEEASENAKELAHALRSVDGVSVNYVEEDFSETRYGLGGGVLSFVFDGEGDVPYKRGRKFDQYLIGNPHTIKHRVSLAEPHTLSITWAGQLGLDAIHKWGVKPGLVRVACGTESDYSQVIDHIKRGIEKSL